MKTDEIRKKDENNFLVLPLKFSSKGFSYEQVLREGDFAIYTQKDKYNKIWYIPMVVQKYQSYEIAGNVMPAAEKMPKDELWGTLAYTELTLEKAKTRLEQLKNYIKTLEQNRLAEKL
jgi:hypothetical protein